MEDSGIQSVETNQEDEEIVQKYSENMSLDEKIASIRLDFESRFPEKEQTYMIRKENFLKHYHILDLLSKVKSIDESLENSHKDRTSIEMLLDLYAEQIIELDSRFASKMESLGEWSEEILDSFIDSGHSMYKRYFTYKLLGHKSSIIDNKYIKMSNYKVIFLRGFFFSMVVLNLILLTKTGNMSNIFRLKKFALQAIFGFMLIVSVAFLFYASGFDYWIRLMTAKFKDYSAEIKEQIRFHVADLNDLHSDVISLREEISFHIKRLIESTMNFKVQSSYDTYLTFSELKRVLINQSFVSTTKQDMLFVLMGIKNLYYFLTDYSFVYWALRSHLNKIGIFFVAMFVGFGFGYCTLPFVAQVRGFWANFVAAIAAEELMIPKIEERVTAFPVLKDEKQIQVEAGSKGALDSEKCLEHKVENKVMVMAS